MKTVPGLARHSLAVTLSGAELFVTMISHSTSAEKPSRPTLVFIHEGLGSVEQWKSFPAELCLRSGCDGVVYDQRGYGRSSPAAEPRSMSFYLEEGGQVLPDLLEALNVNRPILIGHSDGATIALEYASLFPDTCAGVISIAAHVMTEQATIDGVREAIRAYEETDLPLRLSRYHGAKTRAVFEHWAETWLTPSSAAWNMLPDLGRITCPVLAIQGEHDAYGTVRQLDLIAEHCSGRVETHLLPDCAHVPHHEARKQTLQFIAEFISGLYRA